MKICLTALAHRDIAAIKEYIGMDEPRLAAKISRNLYKQAESLTHFPHKGIELSAKFEIQTDLRMLIVSPNLIVYKIVEETIIILRILNGRIDYLSMLSLEP